MSMSERPRTVLIVDDERDLRDLVDFNLQRAGYRTLHAGTGAEALARVREGRPDLVLLDLNLPDVSGTDVCRTLKADEATRDIAVVMLTARGTEADRVVGFELGADDYVVKPFSVRELVLRVDAIFRRLVGGGEAQGARLLRAGPIEIDRETHRVRVGGGEVQLTLLEFRLLTYLISGEGRVRSREELLEKVWEASPELETRTIDTHVKRLREKLGAAGDLIETVRGVGYRLRTGA